MKLRIAVIAVLCIGLFCGLRSIRKNEGGIGH